MIKQTIATIGLLAPAASSCAGEASAQCLRYGGCSRIDRAGANPNSYWQVPSARCYPGVNDYHQPTWRVKHDKCYTSFDYYSGAALEPVNLDNWYGNPYDGF
jgi:hypothetical protein